MDSWTLPVQVGEQIGGYRLERLLGAGGMGAVFEARRLGYPPVALKVLLPGADPNLLARFEREAKVLRHLDSPGIVRLLDYGSEGGRAYLVQELCPEGDLASALKLRGRLEPEEARALTLLLCEALAAAHAVGVVHRDLKPANVLMVSGRPKLTDFGLARAKGIDRASLTETGVFLGTPAYMAPEQLLDAREVDQRSDVYALGVILYELLGGGLPFRGASAIAVADAVLNGQPRPLPSSVPSELQAVVLRAMAREPLERYESAAELAAALRPAPLSLEPEVSAGLSPLAITSLLLVGLMLFVVAGLYAAGGAPAPPPASQTPPSTEYETPSPSDSSSTAMSLDEALDASRDPATRFAGVARIEALARAGDPQAALAYGRFLLSGFGVELSHDRAADYLSQAKSHGIWEATLLLACCHPPLEWRERRTNSLRELSSEAKLGNPAALRFIALNHSRVPPELSEEVASRVGESVVLRELNAFNQCRLRLVGRDETLAWLRKSSSPEARLTRCRIALLDPRPLEVEPDLVQLLQEASTAGSALATALLGEAYSLGRVPGSPALAREWLERAALRGRGDAAFARWSLDKRDLIWLKMSAAFAHGPALLALGEALSASDPDQAEAWLHAAYKLRGEPRAAGLLARLKRAQKKPREAMRLASEAASEPDPANLELYAELLLDPEAAGRADPWAALEILGALACLGDGAAALKAAELTQQIKLPATVARALLRRALYDRRAEVHAGAKARLAELTAEIPATAPVRSQSQLVLLERSRQGDPAAKIEIGRRASLEAPSEQLEAAMIAAAETGDPESRLSLVRLRARSEGITPEILTQLHDLGDAGLYEAWLYVPEGDRRTASALRARLKSLAESSDPQGMFAYGALLCRRRETLERGLEWIRRASAAGVEAALEYESFDVGSLSDSDLLRRLGQTQGRAKTVVALALLQRRARDLRKQGRRALLVAVLLGAPPQDSYVLGKHLVRTGERRPQSNQRRTPDWSVGALWLRVAAQHELTQAQILVGQLYLDLPNPTFRARGFRLVESVARKQESVSAKLAVARACLQGRGTPVDFTRAERELNSVAARSPEARGLLGGLYSARGEPARALSHLQREFGAGNRYARIPLVELHLAQRAPGATVPEGLRLLREGAEIGEPPACFLLADLLQRGQFLEADPLEAARYRRLAQETLQRGKR